MTPEEAEVAAWLRARSERSIETACARIFLAGDVAWKVKRHLDLGYLDFTTPARRRWALDRELAFNRPNAPSIYRGVHALTRAGTGLELDGPGEAVDHLLEMRRFADDAVLSAHPERVGGDLAEALGRKVAQAHARAPLRPDGGADSLAFTIGSNARLLTELADELGAAPVARLIDATQAAFERQRDLLAERAAQGFSRHCHGDLHLGNILVEEGEPVLFDCIEFNDALSDIDVQYDLAFLLMDLEFRGRREAAARTLSAYLDEAARSFPRQLWTGLAALPLMLSVRAAVRAHVLVHSSDPQGARAYLAAALGHLEPRPPMLAAVGGLSGAGKSTAARALAPHLGAAPGAVVIRTDEIRKRLVGVGPTEPVPQSRYTPQDYARTYDEMSEIARALLEAGRAVILDATFIDPALRRRVEDLAGALGVPFLGFWLVAPMRELETRVAARTGDASDATVEVLRDQASRLDPAQVDWVRLDASRGPAQAMDHWRAGAALP